jgi:dihydroneopterin aldolase
MTGTVELAGMEFFAKHGCYTEERKIGNKYTVDVTLQVEMEEAVKSDKLEGTVNYEEVYKIVARIMVKEANLLEYLAGQMVKEIRASFPNVLLAKVTVSKHNPPINGLCDRAKVTIEG